MQEQDKSGKESHRAQQGDDPHPHRDALGRIIDIDRVLTVEGCQQAGVVSLERCALFGGQTQALLTFQLGKLCPERGDSVGTRLRVALMVDAQGRTLDNVCVSAFVQS